jgi:DDE superfamily endonuclease
MSGLLDGCGPAIVPRVRHGLDSISPLTQIRVPSSVELQFGGVRRKDGGQGTSTQFAAFEVALGNVKIAHNRRLRVEFLDFRNAIVVEYSNPDTAIHVILDNLNTHKPKNDRWLKRHPNVHFHFTPTRTPWLNQVEIWFVCIR